MHPLLSNAAQRTLRAAVLIGTLCALMGSAAPLHAQSAPTATPAAAQDAEPLRVVIKALPPFVFPPTAEETNVYRGFSIDLWEEIAHRLGRVTEFVYVDTVQTQLDTVASGAADLGITGLSITREREEIVDFSQPYFEAGLQIMVSAQHAANFLDSFRAMWRILLAPGFILLPSGLGLAILIMAHLFWLTERRRNPEFPRNYFRGIWEGVWYTVVTLLTVGYGDRTAHSVLGRLLAMAWMFAGLLIVANLTASLTSRLTVQQFQGTIQRIEDLPGRRVVTVEGSTTADYLQERRIRHRTVEAIEDAYTLLEQNSVDAIVYDSPVLLYYAGNEGQGRVQLVGGIFERQNYGIAFPSRSTERETVNRALLELQEDGTYDTIYDRWFSAP